MEAVSSGDAPARCAEAPGCERETSAVSKFNNERHGGQHT